MFKRTSILVALLIVFMVSGANAATDLFSVTASDGQEVLIDSLGKVLGLKKTAEVITSSDTVTAVESGKVFLINPVSTTVIETLPTAKAGLEYTFVIVGGKGSEAAVYLTPQSTDTFDGCVSSAVVTTFAAGDRLGSNATQVTSDTVTIVGASTKMVLQ